MRRIYFINLILLFIQLANAQPWLRNLPKASVDFKESKNINFNDIKKAFHEYWEGRTISENESENAKEGGYEQFARWEYMMQYRTYPDGEFYDSDVLYKEFDKIKSRYANNKTSSAANWSYIGQDVIPSNGGGTGRINVIRIHPTDPNTLFIGAACGGIWKSTDGGITWNTSTDLLPSISIADIAINPVHPDTMYAATGDGYGYDDSNGDFWGGIYTGGLFRSSDGGNTWSPTPLSYLQINKQILQRIIINPDNPSILLACSKGFLYRSADAGQNWLRVFTGHFYDLEFKPDDPNVVYAASSTRVYKSVDGGLTFTQNSTGLGTGRKSIAVTPANNDVLYVLCESGEFYKSTDAGVTFVAKTSPTTATTFYGYYDNVLSVSPVNENYVITGGIDIVQSFNGGLSWSQAANNGGNDYVHADQKNLEFGQGSSSTMYAVNDGGIFKTTDGGINWDDLGNNIYIKQYYRMATAMSSPNIYYAGAQDNGTDHFNGATWQKAYGGDGMDCAVNPSDANISYVSSQNGNFRRSLNGGISFTNITPAGQTGDWITPIAISTVFNSTIYIGYQDLYRSVNNGTSWVSISNNVFNGSNIRRLKIAPSDNNYICAASLNSIKRSVDGGVTFTTITNGLPVSFLAVTDLAISASDHDLIWATFSGYTTGQKVFMSPDAGVTWVNISGTLPNVPVDCIVYQPGSNDMLYVGTDLGVYYRDNSMADWLPYNNGLPNVMICDLEIIPSIGKLRAATYGRGIWQTDIEPSVFNSVDAGIISFSPLFEMVCDQNTTPAILVKNYGSSILSSFNVNYVVDAMPAQSFLWTGNIMSLATAAVTLPPITLGNGIHSLLVYLTDPNTIPDPNNVNDSVSISFNAVANSIPAPVMENFEGTFPPVAFTINNPAGILTVTNAAGGFGTSASSLKADYFNTIYGRSTMTSLPIDMTTLSSNAQLTFDVAHQRYPTYYDSLSVQVSTDCGLTWTTVYAKMGLLLSTVPGYLTQPFVPTALQWRNEVVPLSAYATANKLLIRFNFRSGYGNNLYIDNINIDNSTGISEFAENSIKVYPNPANGLINLQLSSEYAAEKLIVEIKDLIGQTVLLKEFRLVNHGELLTIPVQAFETGYYNITVKAKNQSTLNFPIIISN